MKPLEYCPMPTRKTLLRWMLVALAFTAAAGALAVLVNASHVAWQIVGTGFATAAACALMIPIARMLDREKSRPAGLVGMFWVLGEYLLVLTLIWKIPEHLLAVYWEEELAVTALISVPAGPLTMALLKLANQPYGRIAGRLGIVVIIASLLSFWTAIWWRQGVAILKTSPTDYSTYQIQEAWSKTGGAISIHGGLSALCLIGLAAADARRWRWLGVVAGITAGVMWLLDAWLGVGSDPGFVAFCTLTSLAVVIAFTNLALYCPLTPGQSWLRITTVLAAAATAALLDAAFVSLKLLHAEVNADFLFRLASAGGILSGCGAVALVVLARINRAVDYEPLAIDAVGVKLVCPRCRKKQSLQLGNSACSACGLRISIRIEEPRCPQCGYLLFQLTSPRCPECGKPLPNQPMSSAPATTQPSA